MLCCVDSARMGEVDGIAMEETGPNLYQMMENAVKREVIERIHRLKLLPPVEVKSRTCRPQVQGCEVGLPRRPRVSVGARWEADT